MSTIMSSSKLFAGLAILLFVAGCAPMVPQGPSAYQRGLSDLRSSSLSVVNAYSASVAEFLKTNSEDQAIERAKQAVSSALKDPGSAQFRNVRLVPYGQGKVICGEVNGKNSYGGYVGFRPFVASTISSEISSVSARSRYGEIDAAANTGINSACR